jgi:uncharacterized repeat protein (TIGR01451 family)
MSDIDLTGDNSSATINGLIFDWVPGADAGTGRFGTFLTVQNDGTEEGFNTQPRALDDSQHTFAVPFSALGTVDGSSIGGPANTPYYEFQLDINQSGTAGSADAMITLEEMKFYTSSRPATLADYSNGSLGTGFTLAYDLNPDGSQNLLLIDHAAGSGKDDYIFYVPTSDFADKSGFLTLYAKFANANGGFEEFSTLTNNATGALPSLSIVKTVTSVVDANHDGIIDGGDVINYDILVTNTGNETLTGVTVTDPLTGGSLESGGTLSAAGVNSPPGTADFKESYTITAADMTNDGNPAGTGEIVNTATATSDQTPSQNSAVYTLLGVPAPMITITKVAATTPTDTVNDAGQVDHAGQAITYTIEVTNTGTETLTNVVVTDPMAPGGVVGTIASLTIGTVQDLTYTVNAAQAQIDNGSSIVNTATVTDTQGDNQSATATVAIDQDPSLSITKVAATTPSLPGDSANTADEAGQVINYTVTVTNTGNETLTGVTVIDTLSNGASVTLSGGSATLGVNGSETLTGSYTVTQTDVDNGATLTNTATATDDQGDNQPASASTPIDQHPGLTITKVAATTPNDQADVGQVDHAGQQITYTIEVANTGNETLTNVVVTDPNDPNGATVGTIASLAVGAHTDLSYTVTATQTQIDNGGSIVNTASVASDQTPTPENSNTVTTVIDQDPSLTITKVAATTPSLPGDSANTADEAGQVINYTVTVTNTGNETLTGVTVIDTLSNGASVILSGSSATLGVNGSETLTGSYTVLQADVDNGATLTNTASVTDGQGDSGSASASTPIDQHPGLSITKVAATTPTDTADAGQVDHAGQATTYTIEVTNTGNETLTNVAVSDSMGGGSLGTIVSLAVGHHQDFSYTVNATQAQIDAGTAISNTATVTDDQTASKSATATVTIDQDPAISVDKQVSVNGGATWLDVGVGNLSDLTAIALGATVEFRLKVTNTGNLSETGVSATDSALGTTLDGHHFTFGGQGSINLAVGQSTYSDVLSGPTAGGLNTDTAMVTGTAADKSVVTASDSANYTGTFSQTGATTGLTQGYWYNHQSAWHETYLGTKTVANEGVLLGDTTGAITLITGAVPTGMLFIPQAAAVELINASTSANDTRQILLSQALAAQLNIDSGDKVPGDPTTAKNLISEAVAWLEGQVPNSGAAKIDTNGDRILSTGTTNAGYEYNTKTAAFTSPTLTSSQTAWQTQNAIYSADHYHPAGTGSAFGPGAAFSADGEGLKNALQAFNMNHLVTNAGGTGVAWDQSGSATGPYTDLSLNGGNDFWSILHIEANHSANASLLHGIA